MRRQKSTIQYYDKQRTIGPREITLGAAVLALVLCAAVGVIFLLRNSGWIGIAAPPSPTPTETPTPPPTATAPPITLTPETPSAPEAPADAPEPTPQYFEHVVGEGDSLAGLAALYGVPLQRLAEVNNLPLNTMLREGQVLVIPLPPDRAGRWHVVQPGETLIGIAEDYGVEPAQIQSANNIGEGGEIYAGQRIRIPFVPPEDPTPEGSGAGGSPAGDALTLPTRIHRSGWARSTLNGNLARNYPLTHENPRFTLHYQPDSYAAQTLADTVALVEGALTHVEQTLGVHLDGTFDVYLAGTLFAAPNAHLHGVSNSVERQVFVLYDGSGTRADNAYFVAHEIAHMVALNTLGPPGPSYLLSEGVATYAGSGLLAAGDYLSPSAFCGAVEAAGRMPPLADIEEDAGAFRGHIRQPFNYFGAGCFAAYLVDTYGMAKLHAVYASSNYERIYGMTLAELDAEWRAALADHASRRLDPALFAMRADEVAEGYAYVFGGFDESEAHYRAYAAVDQARVALWRGELESVDRWLAVTYGELGFGG
jgi:LysM repeat protein